MRLFLVVLAGWGGGVMAKGQPGQTAAEVKLGERLFFETRFSHAFSRTSVEGLQRESYSADAGEASSASLLSADGVDPGREAAMSCRTCHLSPQENREVKVAALDVLPARQGHHAATLRNSPSLTDALYEGGEPRLLHYDGEFATAEDLVVSTFLGRNFGWLPQEALQAREQFARVIREDDGTDALGGKYGHLAYSRWLRGPGSEGPPELRLPKHLRLDVALAADEEILQHCARAVVAYLQSLRFSRDSEGRHNGSPYDAFLAANRLPKTPARDESPASYGRRLREAVAALRTPRFVDEPSRRSSRPGQKFRFGELELKGMNLFLREGVGRAQTSGAGNCAECHVPPRFADGAFHNTGVAQDDYDSRHSAGAFAALVLPGLAERNADHEGWLPPTPEHPRAKGNARAAVGLDYPERADLGLWNVYGNPDYPKPQAGLGRLLNPGGDLAPDEVLSRTLARFKTTTVRDLGPSAPYFHAGTVASLEEVVDFYRRMSDLARAGKLRNAPPEFFGMRLDVADTPALAAFLRALDEN